VCVFENTLVYLIMKAIWTHSYPWAFQTEVSYPGGGGRKVDLIIYASSPITPIGTSAPRHVIEIKRCFADDTESRTKVLGDLNKVAGYPDPARRYVLVVLFGPNSSAVESELQLLVAVANNCREVFYSEFDTLQDGRRRVVARVSLLELLPRTAGSFPA
jgi:hypothetical protein